MSAELRRAKPLLGTIVEIGATGQGAETAITEAFAAIETIHNLMSFHDAGSDISRLNNSKIGEAVTVDSQTYHVLQFAQHLSRLSNGVFDVTIGKILYSDDANSNYKNLELLPANQLIRNSDIWVDLGGIAKGYAVDCATKILQAKCESGIVNAGGDLRIFGKKQPIHIRNPKNAGAIMFLGEYNNCSIASSSSLFAESLVSAIEKKRVDWEYGVTVIATECMAADALTKIVRLNPPNLSEIITHYNATALLVQEGGFQMLVQKERAA